VDHVDPFEPEILQGYVHRLRDRGRRRPLELEAQPALPAHDEEV